MPRIDLHIHSDASDGRYPPAEIVIMAAEAGLTVIALTDHDTVDGIPAALEMAATRPSLRFIPGVEVSTDVPDGEVHVLGYFVDHTDPALLASLARMRDSRLERARKMVAKLRSLGCRIDWERVLEIAGEGAIGRPHIAQALLEKGYVASFAEAFTRYIGHDGPAYVERDKMAPAEAVGLILAASGLPVLAHPLTAPDPEAMVRELKPAGLIGVEAYYAGHSDEDREWLAELASRHDLIATGGTDYHGLDAGEVEMGAADVPLESVERLLALASQPGLRLASR